MSVPVRLLTSTSLPGTATWLFAAPIIRLDGSFTLLVANQTKTADVLAIDLDASLKQIGDVRTVEGVLPLYGSGSIFATTTTLDGGILVIADPDGELRAVDKSGAHIASLGGLGDLRSAAMVAVGPQRFAPLKEGFATYFNITADEIVKSDTVPLAKGGYRDPVALQQGDQLIRVLSTRDLGDVSDSSDNADTIVVQSIASDGTVRVLDEITSSEWPLSFTDAIAALPEGGFAILIHHGPYGVGGEFAIRRYNNDGTFRSERIVGEGKGSSNNGGYDHQLTALDDGTLILSYQIPTPEGQRYGGHVVKVIDHEPPVADVQSGQSMRSASGGEQRPMIVAHPDGGTLLVWTETTWHRDEGTHKGSLHLTRFDAEGIVMTENAVLLSDMPTFELRTPPLVSHTGALSFVLQTSGSGAMRYGFDANMHQIGAPGSIEAQRGEDGTPKQGDNIGISFIAAESGNGGADTDIVQLNEEGDARFLAAMKAYSILHPSRSTRHHWCSDQWRIQ